MKIKSAFIYDGNRSSQIIGENQIMPPSRLQYTYELLDAYEVFDDRQTQIISPRLATDIEVAGFHSLDYLDVVKKISEGVSNVDGRPYNIFPEGDNPPYLGMYKAALLSTGGSLVAGERLINDDLSVVFNPAGGLHHAMPNYASGFCVFNDVVIAIQQLLRQGVRVAYVDIDAHHGDGVQEGFFGDKSVLTISLHESGRYLFPGSGDVKETGRDEGKGFSVNVPLDQHTDDSTYLWAFRAVVPPLVRAFCPDVLVAQLGIDTHYLDPLTDLCLTSYGFVDVIKELVSLCPKLLALGGGGYDVGAVARGWALAYGVMSGNHLPNEIPKAYRQKFGLKKLHDDAGPVVGQKDLARARKFAEYSVGEIQKVQFPFYEFR